MVNASERDILDHGATQIADPKGGACWWTTLGWMRPFGPRVQRSERTYTTQQRIALPARAGQCACLRKRRHLRNPYRQSMAEPDSSRARESARRPQERIVMRTYCIGGGFRPTVKRRLRRAGCARRQRLGKPVKLVLTRARRHALRLIPLTVHPNIGMAFAAAARSSAMEHHASAGWPTLVMVPCQMVERLV